MATTDGAAEAAPAVSVVVVSYNVRDLLRQCLATLGTSMEVVVVDNASSDDSAGMVRTEFPAVRLVASPDNLGFSRAVNIGVALTTAPNILLLNPDAEIQPDAIAAMVAVLGAREDIAVVGCRQVDEFGRYQLTVGPPPSLLLELGRMFVQRRLDAGNRTVGRVMDRLLSRPRSVAWVTGNCLLVRRAAFDAVAGFDEGFFLYFEDADFCLRLRERRGETWFLPSVTAIHRRGRSGMTNPRLAAREYRRSQLRYWEKHRGRRIARLVALYQRSRFASST